MNEHLFKFIGKPLFPFSYSHSIFYCRQQDGIWSIHLKKIILLPVLAFFLNTVDGLRLNLYKIAITYNNKDYYKMIPKTLGKNIIALIKMTQMCSVGRDSKTFKVGSGF